jgi:hypothetical protein
MPRWGRGEMLMVLREDVVILLPLMNPTEEEFP